MGGHERTYWVQRLGAEQQMAQVWTGRLKALLAARNVTFLQHESGDKESLNA